MGLETIVHLVWGVQVPEANRMAIVNTLFRELAETESKQTDYSVEDILSECAEECPIPDTNYEFVTYRRQDKCDSDNESFIIYHHCEHDAKDHTTVNEQTYPRTDSSSVSEFTDLLTTLGLTVGDTSHGLGVSKFGFWTVTDCF